MTNQPITREQHLRRIVARYFAKRHNGAWYRSAVRAAIRELRDERGSCLDPDTGLPISGWGIDYDRSHPTAGAKVTAREYKPVLPREHAQACRRGQDPTSAHYGLDRARCERCRNLWKRLLGVEVPS